LLARARWAEEAGFATGWVPHIPWSLDALTALEEFLADAPRRG